MRDGPVRRAVRGGITTLVGQAANAVLQILNLIILSRLLTPAEFGTVASVVAVVGLAELVRDMGITSAAVQSPSLNPKEKSNLFWLGSALGLVLSVGLVVASPLLGDLFNDPLVTPVAMALSMVFLLSGVTAQFQVELLRSMRIKALTGAMLAARVIGLLAAILGAVLGMGVWSLVLQTLTVALVAMLVMMALVPWKPGLPQRTTSIRRFLRFGVNMSGASLWHNLGQQSGVLALSLLGSSPSDIGSFSRAQQVAMQPNSLVLSPLGTVGLAAMSRMAPAQLGGYYRRLEAIIAMFGAVAFSFIAISSPLLVPLLLGGQWSSAIPLVTWLGISGIWMSPTYVLSWHLTATGRSSRVLSYTAVTRSILVAATLAGASISLDATAVAVAISQLIAWGLAPFWLAGTGVSVDITALFKSAAIPVLGSAITVLALGAGFLAQSVGITALRSTLLSVATWICLLAASLALPQIRHTFRMCLILLRGAASDPGKPEER